MEYNLLDEKINHVKNEVDKAKAKVQDLKPTEKEKVKFFFLIEIAILGWAHIFLEIGNHWNES